MPKLIQWKPLNVITVNVIVRSRWSELPNPNSLITSRATRLCSGCLFSALSLCHFVSMSPLYISVSPSISPKPNLTLNLTARWLACVPAHPSLSRPPSLSSQIPCCWGSYLVGQSLFYVDLHNLCVNAFIHSYHSVNDISFPWSQSDHIWGPYCIYGSGSVQETLIETIV
jgi:hypothetical protein